MGVVIVFAEIVRVVRRDQRNLELFLQAEHVVLDFLVEFEPMILQFEEEVAVPEDIPVLNRGALGALVVVLHQVLRQLTCQAARKTDQAACVLGQVLFRNTRLAVEAVQRRLGGNADEVAVALFVLRQHQQMVVVVALRVGAVVLLLTHVQLAAEDRLDALLFRSLEKMHGAVNIAVIGNRNRGLAYVLDALD